MRRFFVLFVFFLCGCAGKVQLNCSYIDNSSIFGSKKVNDLIEFKKDRIIYFERNIDFNINLSGNKRDVYRIVKSEGKALKKYIGGKYRINYNSDSIDMVFHVKRFNNLKYIGIDSEYGYDSVLSVYSELGFECK